MTTTLRQVLDHFEQQSVAVSLPQMARDLGIERTMLESMIEYWIRKGRLREVSAPACDTCGSAQGCPFIMTLPRRYELATGEPQRETPSCGCGSGGTCH